jgi:hypothetical protein
LLRQRVILLVQDHDIRIVDPNACELRRHLTLDPTRNCQPTGAPQGPKAKDETDRTIGSVRLRSPFDAVLILHLYRIPPQLAATILGHGISLIHEYHHIMDSYLKDPDTMRDHPTSRGVKLPAQVPETC